MSETTSYLDKLFKFKKNKKDISRNVKKINSFGKVSLSNYESFFIRNIDDNLKKMVKNVKKI